MPKLRNTKASQEELRYQFGAVDDEKLRLTLSLQADQLSEQVREYIYRVYNDPEINSWYRETRSSGIYQKGTKSKRDPETGKVVFDRRLIIKYPDPYIYDFIKTVMTSLYGEEWWKNRKALRHELVRPWHVVNDL